MNLLDLTVGNYSENCISMSDFFNYISQLVSLKKRASKTASVSTDDCTTYTVRIKTALHVDRGQLSRDF